MFVIAVGTVAPDFELVNQLREPVRLSDFRHRQHVVLAFHPLAFTPVCSAQVESYERERARLDALGARVLAISTDPGPSKKAWADSLGVSYDLLSDFHPHGQVAAAYGVLREDGLAERALVVVDKRGIVGWTRLYDMPEHPDPAELLAALRHLES